MSEPTQHEADLRQQIGADLFYSNMGQAGRQAGRHKVIDCEQTISGEVFVQKFFLVYSQAHFGKSAESYIVVESSSSRKQLQGECRLRPTYVHVVATSCGSLRLTIRYRGTAEIGDRGSFDWVRPRRAVRYRPSGKPRQKQRTPSARCTRPELKRRTSV